MKPIARLYEQNGYRRASVKPGPGKPLVLLEDAEKEIERLRETLAGIANADWRNWEELASPDEFVRWAKSRAQHALTHNAEYTPAQVYIPTNTPREDEKPEGFEPIADDTIVKDGDMVLDYLHAKGFATIISGGMYDRLIGKTGYFARLDQLAYEVFTTAANTESSTKEP